MRYSAKSSRFIAVLVAVAMTLSALQIRAQDPAATSTAPQIPDANVLIVVGAGGEDEYRKAFEDAANKWKVASEAAKLNCRIIGLDDTTDAGTKDRDAVLDQLEKWKSSSKDDTLWLVMIGHGTTGKQHSNFNLRGQDVSVQELKPVLQSIPARLVVAACFSTSGVWVPELAGPNRVTISATKSGSEYNYSRFAKYFAESINDLSIDLDHDREVSLLEAFLSASRRTARFYQDGNRLASEHAILDDNGDGKGTTADFYEGLQAKSKAADNANIDGTLSRRISFVRNQASLNLTSEQLQQRDELESELEKLRQIKETMSEDDYYAALEKVLLQLGRIYHGQSAEGGRSL